MCNCIFFFLFLSSEKCISMFLVCFSLHDGTAGCYIGQETIARLITYDGVKQQLWSVHMNGFAEPETVVSCDGVKVCFEI